MIFVEWIKNLMSNGTLPTVGALIVGTLTIGLEVAKNKLIKKLSKSEADNAALAEKIEKLEEENKQNAEMTANTNAIINAVIDMLHVAYSGSKLGLEAKLQLQKIYDNCPDALSTAVDLIDLIGKVPTVEQIEQVEETVQESYADIIAKKYTETE